MKKDKMRRSSNVRDTRKPEVSRADDYANDVASTVDDGVMAQHSARLVGTPQQREIEKSLTYLLDSIGDKGKGRYGGGRLNQSRFDQAVSRAKYRWTGTMGGKKK